MGVIGVGVILRRGAIVGVTLRRGAISMTGFTTGTVPVLCVRRRTRDLHRRHQVLPPVGLWCKKEK